MKRVKIMLAAITVLASVGGALAFKAKTFSQFYCIKTTDNGGGVCTTSLQGKPGGDTFYYYTLTITPTLCNQNTRCTRSIRLVHE
ncbi:hypothetical protein [Chitinophaga rupis]|uniref:hypothetical protein n=1 Tax=Chitinophaga rupis TaxID=573321 RepID=UPI0011601453|nr:hypothetical protein [Chitinophaga rupis]